MNYVLSKSATTLSKSATISGTIGGDERRGERLFSLIFREEAALVACIMVFAFDVAPSNTEHRNSLSMSLKLIDEILYPA